MESFLEQLQSYLLILKGQLQQLESDIKEKMKQIQAVELQLNNSSVS
jgi:hypothetical protein